MKTSVFLKFHRTDPASVLCLRFWCELFKNYKTYILCDRYDPKTEPVPEYLKTVLEDYNLEVINSDYNIGKEYCQSLKGAKKAMASANMTAFQYTDECDSFWMVDADDTLFLTRDFDNIRSKLNLAETYFVNNNLDAFSLDFYRNLNNCWTFGLALLNAKMDWKQIKNLSAEEVAAPGLARNIDIAFDLLGKKGIFKIKNFVFNDTAFQHQCNNYPDMPHGIYIWNRAKLWSQHLQEDVVVL